MKLKHFSAFQEKYNSIVLIVKSYPNWYPAINLSQKAFPDKWLVKNRMFFTKKERISTICCLRQKTLTSRSAVIPSQPRCPYPEIIQTVVNYYFTLRLGVNYPPRERFSLKALQCLMILLFFFFFFGWCLKQTRSPATFIHVSKCRRGKFCSTTLVFFYLKTHLMIRHTRRWTKRTF